MADVAVTFAPAGDIVVVDRWTDAVPDFGRARAVQVEPRRWWLIDSRDSAMTGRGQPRDSVAGDRAPPGDGDTTPTGGFSDNAATPAAWPGDGGAAVAIGPGLTRATVTGRWRALLMIAGVFDAEDPGFGPGDCAATVIHHVPVWIVPVANDCAEVFFAASYTAALVDLWTAAIDRGIA